MGSSLEIERITLIVERGAGRQIHCGWQYYEGEAEAERVVFNSMAGLSRFVSDVAKLLPKPRDQIKNTDLDWEWVVALALLHRAGNETDWYIGRNYIEPWINEMFDEDDDDPDDLYSDFAEKLGDLIWTDKYQEDPTIVENDIKALNMFLYLSKPRPPEAAIRAARRLGLTLKPGEGRLIFDSEPEPAEADAG